MRCWGELKSLRAQKVLVRSVRTSQACNLQNTWKWKSARPTTSRRAGSPPLATLWQPSVKLKNHWGDKKPNSQTRFLVILWGFTFLLSWINKQNVKILCRDLLCGMNITLCNFLSAEKRRNSINPSEKYVESKILTRKRENIFFDPQCEVNY